MIVCPAENIIVSKVLNMGGRMDMKKRWKLAGLGLLALSLLYLHKQHHITMEEILSWQPENLVLAAAALLCLFAVKSATVFIPIMIPQILAGHLYSRDMALLINLLGLVIVMSVPYWIGKGLRKSSKTAYF